MPNVAGIEIILGGVTRVLPPLNAASVKQYRAELATVFETGLGIDLEFVAKIAHAALKRNYPEVTLAEVEDFVDYSNVVDIFEAVVNVSGLMAKMGNLMRRTQEGLKAPG